MSNKIVNHIESTKFLSEDVWFSEAGKFIYFKSSRTAGTSILRGVFHDKHNKKTIPLAVKNFDMTLTDKEIKSDYFTFTFVRNPFEKIVSCYHFIQNNPSHANWRRDIKLSTFGDFIENKLVDKNGYVTDGHWLPFHYYAYSGGERIVDFIGRFETLDDDWSYIGDKLYWKDSKLPHYQGHPDWETTGDGKSYRDMYTEKTRNIVANIYSKDLKLFGYEF